MDVKFGFNIKEVKLKAFENRTLRKIFGPKRDVVWTGLVWVRTNTGEELL
jgi:hypothetical protein